MQHVHDKFNVDAPADEDSMMFKNATVSNIDINFIYVIRN